MVQVSKEYLKNNPFKKSNICILVTSWEGHRMFMKYALRRYMETGQFVLVSFDSHGQLNITQDVYEIPHAWVMKHRTFGATKRNGWLWDIVYGAAMVKISKSFDYVFTTNSDCIWDKPKNINKIIELLGDNDLISSSSYGGTIHTCNVLWRRDVFLRFTDYIMDCLNRDVPESFSPEVLLRDWVIGNKIKVKDAPKQPIYPKNHTYQGAVDHYSAYHQDSTWKEILGYRNLGGEHKAACLEHLEPVPKKYITLKPMFFNKHEKDTLLNYYLTDDRRWLYKYYAEGEDSYWNRRYYPLEWYGLEPLYDDSKRKKLGPPSERLGHFNRWKYNSFVLKDDEYHRKWKQVIKESGL